MGAMATRKGSERSTGPLVVGEALELFRRWGREGGKKRAQKLSAKQRQELARQASLARWSRAKAKKRPKKDGS